ncbi:MAG: hypothetical protein QM217_07345 [Bacillota bacterium]|jgi:protein-tyrosine phosphatase|nr:hypothetical protein [Bacillota bacterium]
MEEYVDIHCHILPGIDDGSSNMEETLQMIEVAYNDGIRTIITTPHYHEGRFKNKVAEYEAALNDVKRQVKDKYPDLNLYLGCEIYYSHECIDLLDKQELPTMAGSRYILLEFSPGKEYSYIKKSLQKCLFAGYLPILAHVERYKSIEQDIDLVEDLINMGAYIQVNANSIIGKSGGRSKKFTRNLLQRDMVHFIGTDSHNMNSRSPSIKKCVNHINKRYGTTYLEKWLVDNPRKILNKEYI